MAVLHIFYCIPKIFFFYFNEKIAKKKHEKLQSVQRVNYSCLFSDLAPVVDSDSQFSVVLDGGNHYKFHFHDNQPPLCPLLGHAAYHVKTRTCSNNCDISVFCTPS